MVGRELKLIADPRMGSPFYALEEAEAVQVERLGSFWGCLDPESSGLVAPNMPVRIDIPKFLIRLGEGWKVTGHRTVLHESGTFLIDRVVDTPNSALFSLDRETRIRQAGTDFSIADEARTFRELPPNTGLALSTEPSNWGSFLVRILPKAMKFLALGCDYLLVYAKHPNTVELLCSAGWPADRIISYQPGVEYGISDALFMSEPCKNLYLDPEAVRLLRKLNCNFGKDSRRLFISRSSGVAKTRGGRTCINTPELENLFREFEYEIVYPDLLTASEQIQAFSEAAIVAGPSGAGMFNSLFAGTDVKVLDIESERDWIYGHSNLFSSLGAHYGFFFGKSNSSMAGPHRPYHVDVPALRACLDFVERLM